jgi:hypothetical protein
LAKPCSEALSNSLNQEGAAMPLVVMVLLACFIGVMLVGIAASIETPRRQTLRREIAYERYINYLRRMEDLEASRHGQPYGSCQ